MLRRASLVGSLSRNLSFSCTELVSPRTDSFDLGRTDQRWVCGQNRTEQFKSMFVEDWNHCGQVRFPHTVGRTVRFGEEGVETGRLPPRVRARGSSHILECVRGTTGRKEETARARMDQFPVHFEKVPPFRGYTTIRPRVHGDAGVWPRLGLRQILQHCVATIRIAASELDPLTKCSGGRRRASPRVSTTKRRQSASRMDSKGFGLISGLGIQFSSCRIPAATKAREQLPDGRLRCILEPVKLA